MQGFCPKYPNMVPQNGFFFAKREIDKQKHRQVGTLHVVWSGVN